MSSSSDDSSYDDDDSSSSVSPPVSTPNTDFVNSDKECSICSEEFDNPIKLVCGHVYCFLCLKGSMLNQTIECPLCRKKFTKEFVYDVFHNPQKLCMDDMNNTSVQNNTNAQDTNQDQQSTNHIDDSSTPSSDNADTEHVWVYSSKSHAWWTFDKKATLELELNYQKWKNSADKSFPYPMMICGLMLDIDFNAMIQINKKNNSHRDIRRLTPDEYEKMCNKKKIIGVSGIIRNNKSNK